VRQTARLPVEKGLAVARDGDRLHVFAHGKGAVHGAREAPPLGRRRVGGAGEPELAEGVEQRLALGEDRLGRGQMRLAVVLPLQKEEHPARRQSRGQQRQQQDEFQPPHAVPRLHVLCFKGCHA
jgi:hypothetical protein